MRRSLRRLNRKSQSLGRHRHRKSRDALDFLAPGITDHAALEPIVAALGHRIAVVAGLTIGLDEIIPQRAMEQSLRHASLFESLPSSHASSPW